MFRAVMLRQHSHMSEGLFDQHCGHAFSYELLDFMKTGNNATTEATAWVKLRRTQYAHMFSALPSNSDIAQSSRMSQRYHVDSCIAAMLLHLADVGGYRVQIMIWLDQAERYALVARFSQIEG